MVLDPATRPVWWCVCSPLTYEGFDLKDMTICEVPVPVASMPMATPDVDVETDTSTSPDLPWLCIVWDDPVNLMSYVTYVFETVLGYGRARATELMMTVHTKGKAVVSSGDRDKVEADVKKLQTAGLWATMQRSEG